MLASKATAASVDLIIKQINNGSYAKSSLGCIFSTDNVASYIECSLKLYPYAVSRDASLLLRHDESPARGDHGLHGHDDPLERRYQPHGVWRLHDDASLRGRDARLLACDARLFADDQRYFEL